MDVLRRVAKNNRALLRCWSAITRRCPQIGTAAIRFTALWDAFTDSTGQLDFQARLQIFCDGLGEFLEEVLTAAADWVEGILALDAAEQAAALRKVPKKRLSSLDAKNGVGQLRVSCCSVCLEDFKLHDDVRILRGCKHVFHCRCVDQWLYRRQVCPVCRHTLKV